MSVKQNTGFFLSYMYVLPQMWGANSYSAAAIASICPCAGSIAATECT